MKLPIQYRGVLNNVRLINFSVEPDEVLPFLPAGIVPDLYRKRVLFSMVNVQLSNMRPMATGNLFSFNYRHVAFRMLMQDAQFTGEPNRGIYFYRSFTDRPLVYHAGKLLTTFRFQKAAIHDMGYLFELRAGDKYVKYALDNGAEATGDIRLRERVGRIDRAYAPIGKDLFCLQVQREHWPIEWVECYRFETNFFESVRFEGAFQIKQPIDYTWGGLRKVKPQNPNMEPSPQFIYT